jgi:hypothetical protein
MSTVCFIAEANGFLIYLLRPESENYLLKHGYFPFHEHFWLFLFTVSSLFEFIKFSIKVYRRHKKNIYKISNMHSGFALFILFISFFVGLNFELIVGWFIEYHWRLGLHAIILAFLFSYSFDLSRKKQIILIKAFKRLHLKDKGSLDYMTISFYSAKNILWAIALLITYTGFPISVVIFSPGESIKTVFLLTAFVDGVCLLIVAPLYLVANSEANKVLRKIGLKQ